MFCASAFHAILLQERQEKGENRNRTERILVPHRPASHQKNVAGLVERGRMRWKIENEGFNTQKRQGYHLEHQYSKNYRALKNHYYLIQIGHMIN